MTELIFNITTTIAIVASLVVAWGIFVYGRQFGDETLMTRRYAALIFTVGAAQMASMYPIIKPQGVEICASLPLVIMTILMTTTAMCASAVMGRTHHKNFALWVLMMFVPFVSLLAHLMMKGSGNYRPIFSLDDIAAFRATQPMVYYGRAVFVAILMTFWILSVGMVAEAYIHYSKARAMAFKTEDAEQRDGKAKLAITWTSIDVAWLLTWCLPCIVPHIIYNVIVIAALIITALAYRRHVRYIRARNEGRLATLQIERRIPLLLAMDAGGTTEWGVALHGNPLFEGKPMLDDVAQALGVRSADLSEYIQQAGLTFLAWVSDIRLRHCAALLADTDRKIIDIALAAGYNDLSTFTRAFKRLFGSTPSEYRKENRNQN